MRVEIQYLCSCLRYLSEELLSAWNGAAAKHVEEASHGPDRHQGREGPEDERAIAARSREREADPGVEPGGQGGVGGERRQAAAPPRPQRQPPAPAAPGPGGACGPA